MNKPLLTLTLLLLITLPLASASLFDDLVSTQTNKGDGVCDHGEKPYLEECKLTIEKVRSGTSFQEMWLIRLLIITGLLFFAYKKNYIPQEALIVGIIALLIFNFVPFGSDAPAKKQITIVYLNETNKSMQSINDECFGPYTPVCYAGITYDNQCYADKAGATNTQKCIPIYTIEKVSPSKAEQFINGIFTLPERISDSPFLGWIALIIGVFFLTGFFSKGAQIRDHFLDGLFGRPPRR